MSWQRILEIARRQKMPMIVTDIAGREPMVIMPLDEYESLSEGRGSGLGAGPVLEPERFEPMPAVRSVGPTTPMREPEIQTMPDSAEVSPENPQAGEMALEERFYLEPVEDGLNEAEMS